MSDNFSFDLTGVPLELALSVAGVAHSKVEGYRVDEEKNRLVLYWTSSAKAALLPAPMKIEDLTSFIHAWLETADYGPEPDCDGFVRKGWRVYNESWGHVGNEWQAFVAIEPTWLAYSK